LRGALTRLLAAIGCASMCWLGCSGAIAFEAPIEFSLTVRLIITAVVAVCGFLAPSLGVVVASIILGIGVILAGQPVVGIVILVGLVAWWILCGRRSPVDATIMACTPLAAALGFPFVIALLTGLFLKVKRSFGLALTSGLLLTLLTTLAPAEFSHLWFSSFAAPELLFCDFVLKIWPAGSDLFSVFITTWAHLETIIVLIAWLIASFLLSVVSGRKSQVLWFLGVFLATLILAVGVLVLPVTTGSLPDLWALLERVIGLVVSFVLMLIMIAIGVEARPDERKAKAS